MHLLLSLIFNVQLILRVLLQSTNAFLQLISSMNMDINMQYPRPYGIPSIPGCLSLGHMIITLMSGIQIQLRLAT